jgi:hypothetical protein
MIISVTFQKEPRATASVIDEEKDRARPVSDGRDERPSLFRRPPPPGDSGVSGVNGGPKWD